MPVPTIGRIVHFQTYGSAGGAHPSEPMAAIVTGTYANDDVNLFVIYENGTSHKHGIPFAAEPTPGHWNWPPRV